MKKLALALTACTALALTACSDSEPSEKAEKEESALTQKEFVTQANAICKAGEERVTKAAEGLGDSPTAADIEAFVKETAIPETEQMGEKIDDLEPPKDLEADVDAMLESLETDLDKVEADWQAFMADDFFTDFNTKATKLGLTDCDN